MKQRHFRLWQRNMDINKKKIAGELLGNKFKIDHSNLHHMKNPPGCFFIESIFYESDLIVETR